MMFEYLADDIALYLIKRKIIQPDDRELYRYGAEVLLLNLLNVLIALIITVLSGTWFHFAALIMLFVPLRMLIGGYHAKKSSHCLIISTIYYVITVFLIKRMPTLYQSKFILSVLIISAILILIYAPVEHPNNPLDPKSRRRNRILSSVSAVLYTILFAVFYYYSLSIASSMAIFMVTAAVLMITGKLKNKTRRH